MKEMSVEHPTTGKVSNANSSPTNHPITTTVATSTQVSPTTKLDERLQRVSFSTGPAETASDTTQLAEEVDSPNSEDPELTSELSELSNCETPSNNNAANTAEHSIAASEPNTETHQPESEIDEDRTEEIEMTPPPQDEVDDEAFQRRREAYGDEGSQEYECDSQDGKEEQYHHEGRARQQQRQQHQQQQNQQNQYSRTIQQLHAGMDARRNDKTEGGTDDYTSDEDPERGGASSAVSDYSGSESDSDCQLDDSVIEEMESFLADFKGIGKRFRLINKIGEGTFSSVYKAQDLHYDKYENPWDTDDIYHPRESPPPSKRRKVNGYPEERNASPPRRRPKYVAIKKIYVTSSPQRIQNELELLHTLNGSEDVVPLITAFRHHDQVVVILPYFKHVDYRVGWDFLNPL